MNKNITKKALEELIRAKLSHLFGVEPEDATNDQFYRVLSIISRDMVRDIRRDFNAESKEAGRRRFITSAWSSSWAEASKTLSTIST